MALELGSVETPKKKNDHASRAGKIQSTISPSYPYYLGALDNPGERVLLGLTMVKARGHK
ncbi:hypothetical protein SESBI_39667 [Sesbania bispinosa]|nr:hypothetical protein SESBI_39667 [Sesbania bispinosa]